MLGRMRSHYLATIGTTGSLGTHHVCRYYKLNWYIQSWVERATDLEPISMVSTTPGHDPLRESPYLANALAGLKLEALQMI